MSIGVAFALVIFPPACEMTLLVSDLAFATRTIRKAVEQGGSLPVCLSICVQRAALKTPPPFGRTLSFPESASRLSRGVDSCPQAMYGPPPDCKQKVRMRRNGLRQCIRPVGEALASGHDVLRAPLDLTSCTASNAFA
jgi:hypothetical protein